MPNSGERRRTMVYSNVGKKAEKKSASQKNEKINLDDEIVIGLAKVPEKNVVKEKKNKNKKKNNYKGNDDLKALWESEKEELKKEEKLAKKQNGNILKTSLKKIHQKHENNKQEDDEEKTKDQNPKEKNHKQPKQGNSNSSKNNIFQKEIKVNIPKQQQQKTLSIQERIKKQKRKIIRRLAAVVLLIILLIGGFIYFLLSPVFNIKNIDVKNNNNISSQEIINMSGINVNQNMFKMSKGEAKKAILTNPYIEDVKIKRKLFNTIQIEIKERTATLMLEYGNSFVYINNQGYILEISTEKMQVPMLTGYVTPLDQVKPGNRLSKEDLERLTTVLNIMEVANSNGVGPLITKIDVKSKKNYILTLESEDKIIYLGECSDLSTQMLFIKEMIEREKGIDGEFFINMDLNTNKPVFREKV